MVKLGISSNADALHSPHPYRLHRQVPFDYLEYSAPIELDVAMRETSLFAEMLERRSEVPLLFHPVELNLYGPELESGAKLSALSDHLARVGSPWVSNDVAWWHSAGHLWPGYQYLAPPFTARGLEDCTVHALHVQSAIEVPLLLENPAVITRRGEMHVLDFMAELHTRTGCMLLLDLGHLLAYQLSAGLALESGLDAFPLEVVQEIHIAGGMIASRGARTFYFDAHAEPVREELFGLLAAILPRCTRLRAVTYEADGHTEEMAAVNLRRLRAILGSHAPIASLQHRLSDEARRVAEEAYAGTGADREGSEVEREYRVAILASEIDRRFPETRARVAPDLSEFARSPEFLARTRSIADAFSRWARRKLMEHPDEEGARIYAMELMRSER